MTFLRNSWCVYGFLIAIMSTIWGVRRGGTAQANSYSYMKSWCADGERLRDLYIMGLIAHNITTGRTFLFWEICLFLPSTPTKVGSSASNWIIPRIMHYISFALHFICITFKKSAMSA